MNLISNIDIKTFRGIHSLRLDDLAQINVLTGNNNCGKTSILEIIESFAAPESFMTWRSLIRRDGGRIIFDGISYYEGFYDLFDVNSTDKEIEYTMTMEGKTTKVLLSAEEVEEELTESQYYEIMDFAKNEEISDDSLHIVSKLKIKIEVDDKCVAQDSIYEEQLRFFPHDRVRQRKNIVYISPFRHTEGMLFLGDVLNIPDLYEEMLGVLKDFDENILSINYSNDEGKRRGIYKILSKSQKKALPLNVYGDGMKKAILLMSAVIKAENGILLLDEFETAIHTSAMDKVFRWILETCKKLNVQVFMTSHSKEAIEKILKCAPNLKNDIAVYTIYKDESGSSVRRLTAEKAIEVQDEMRLELR